MNGRLPRENTTSSYALTASRKVKMGCDVLENILVKKSGVRPEPKALQRSFFSITKRVVKSVIR